MSPFQNELRMATRKLPADLQAWMLRALDSGWFNITSETYDSGDGSRCPVGAAATMAGAWVGGGITGKPGWGTAEGPSPEVEDFAAYFDLASIDIGVEKALALVRQELTANSESTAKAA